MCKICSENLFLSSTKYDSGSGWPSFFDVIDKSKVTFKVDASGMAIPVMEFQVLENKNPTDFEPKAQNLFHIF